MSKILSVVTIVGFVFAQSALAGDAAILTKEVLGQKAEVFAQVSKELKLSLLVQQGIDMAEHLSRLNELNARASIELKSCESIERTIAQKSETLLSSKRKIRDQFIEKELATLPASDNSDFKDAQDLSTRLKSQMEYCKGLASILRSALTADQ